MILVEFKSDGNNYYHQIFLGLQTKPRENTKTN